MQVFVKFEVFNTITKREDVLRLREQVGRQLEKVQKSGKLKTGSMFGDARGGFFVLDVQSSEEVFDLLGAPILDSFRVETHPLITFQQIAEFFKKDSAAQPQPVGAR